MDVLKQYLQAEVWRLVEEAEGAPRRDPVIEAAARSAGPQFPVRVRARAAEYLRTTGKARDLDHFSARLRLVCVLLAAAAFVIGLGITRVFPNEDGAAVNVVAVLGALLLPNALSLLLWLAGYVMETVSPLRFHLRGLQPAALRGMQIPPPETRAPLVSAAGWLGVHFAHAIRLLAGHQRAATLPAAHAWSRYLVRTASGRARLGLLSHLLWSSLLLGSLAGCATWFTLKQVNFHWGSTVLGETTVARILAAATRPVAAAGIPVPTPGQIAQSRLGAASAASAPLRQRWGYFVLGALAMYGLLPRFAAALLTWSLMRMRERSLVLDEAEPGYARLRTVLMPAQEARVLDPDTPAAGEIASATARIRDDVPPPGAWLALERDSAPAITPLLNLGVVTDRGRQREVIDMTARATGWPVLVVQALLTTTPDRGLERFLAALVSVAHCPVVLQLADSEETAEWRRDEYAQRIEDWVALGLRAKLPATNIRRPLPSTVSV